MFVTGGIEVHVAGVVVRSRDPGRALLVAVALLLVQALFYQKAFAGDLDRLSDVIRRDAPWLACAVAAIILIDAFHFGGSPAGGADSYGYVSQAYGWVSHHLPSPYNLALSLPFPSSDLMQIPLGYCPGPAAHTMVPVYAPGLPLLMTGPIVAFGAIGPYVVVPVCAALLVWFTFCLARTAFGPSGGVVAAVIAATSPIVLFMSIPAMSDLPAGALWTGAVVGAVGESKRTALLGGLAAAFGLLVRPNLPLLAVVLAVWILAAGRSTQAVVRAALFCVPLIVAATTIAVLYRSWYGSPFESGYGPTHDLYALANLWPNLQRYPVWLWQSQGPWILLALVGLGGFAWRVGSRTVVGLCAMVFVTTLASYLFYLPWEAWWYLRFLLPGFGALYVLTAGGVVWLARRVPRPWGRVVAAAIVLLMVRYTVGFAIGNAMFGPIRDSEQRYADVAEFIARTLPPNAVVFAMQHSGNIRIWGGRMTLRYDFIDPAWESRVIPYLEHQGFHPYLAIDDWEAPDVKQHFAIGKDTPFTWPLVGRMQEHGGVTVYDLATHPVATSPIVITPGLAPRYSAPRPVVLEPTPPAN